ncbi:hypothetical protein [Neorhodopirellula pilleata]|uniref:Type II secretion system protein GspF domain-containing protein n=1 Tax=Neorhodopirellula pilleata TaxID=2714738 RepID=A0A5C5ZYH9_9BACT|nr:hypothetical protein [Neorhodopirellula pilleata]TWT92246.1 hypothetical protein Pla100_47830 [Neorhodopirellula pilleata]
MNRSSIGRDAELEVWRHVRIEARRRLSGTLTIGFVYLLLALLVGAFLIHAVEDVAHDTVYLQGWNQETLELRWMTELIWGYVGIGILALVGYVMAMLMIHHRLPGTTWQMIASTPWVGSTMRIVAVADFCQSMFHSLGDSLTYDQAFSKAAVEMQSDGLKPWSTGAAEQIRSGRSIGQVLSSCPTREGSIMALAAMTQSQISADQSLRVWHDAATECHELIASRLQRTIQVISIFCLLGSVGLAAFAMLVSTRFMASVLGGLT